MCLDLGVRMRMCIYAHALGFSHVHPFAVLDTQGRVCDYLVLIFRASFSPDITFHTFQKFVSGVVILCVMYSRRGIGQHSVITRLQPMVPYSWCTVNNTCVS